MRFTKLSAAAVLTLVVLARTTTAEDAYYHLSLEDLELTVGQLPAPEAKDWRTWRSPGNRSAYAVLNGTGEVYVAYGTRWQLSNGRRERELVQEIAVRVPQAREITGKIYLPTADKDGMQIVGFRMPSAEAAPKNREEFYQLKLTHYDNLLNEQLAGAAWFRHQRRQARSALSEKRQEITLSERRPPRSGTLADTYAMFTGGRAMSENLQLDRVLQPADGSEKVIELGSIEGITIREIDWKTLVEGLDPERDPLADKIPADQHAIFFPSFDAAVTVADEITEQGELILQLAEPRSTNARTFERYQQQMGLTLTGMSRLLGPMVVQSVALTGSDPYFRTGTDVAVLFETDHPARLEEMLMAQIKLAVAGDKSVKRISGSIGKLSYRGVRGDDRRVCSYVAKAERVVIVTNSPFQLEQFVRTSTGKSAAIASLDEYTFFRDRYQRGDPSETAFLFLSDATIRRWCGARWRIATSRRIRDAAVLGELQASQLDRLVRDHVTTGPLYTDLPIGNNNEITVTSRGVRCESIGSLAFMTPISEMDVERVTKEEAEAYRRWRNRYQNNWRWAFDPIGLRLGIEEHRLSADLTVMPLIWGSDYREIISFSQGAAFGPQAGDIHSSLAHVLLAVNTDSAALKRQTNLLRMMTGDVKIEPLSWLGNNVGIYVDDAPFWEELSAVPSDQLDEFLEEKGWQMPIAVRADVSSGMKLTLFLGAVRAFIEQASPGMLNWESGTYKEQPYVRITPTERAIGRTEEVRNLAIYYLASGTSLTVTLNEDVLKRAIERDIAREQAKENGQELPPPEYTWMGSNLALHVSQKILRVLASISQDAYQRTMQAHAWANLPILNEWKRRYGDVEPVALHQRFWHERLICPGGGEYVWNPKWQTMESTVYGCPAAPKKGPVAPPPLQSLKRGSFGLTFEEQGLRSRVQLER